MRLSLPLAALAAGLALAGCESELDAPAADLSLQTRSALEVLPAGADAVAMLDVQAVRESPVGRAGGPFSVEGMSGEVSARFDEFVRLTGFDPEEDLTRVYVAVLGAGEAARPAFVVYGAFDRARIDAYLQAQAPAAAALERTTLGGLPAYLGTDEDGRRFGLALVNDEMALAGEEAALRAMVARLATPGGGLDTDAAMMRLVARAVYDGGAWFAARGLDRHAPDGAGMGELARAGGRMAEGVLSFDFRADGVALHAVGFPHAGADAEAVADLVRGAVAAARTQAADEPAAVRALDDVDVRASDGAVVVRGFMPEALLDRLTHDG